MEKEGKKKTGTQDADVPRAPFIRVVVGATSIVMAVFKLTYPLLSFRRRSGM